MRVFLYFIMIINSVFSATFRFDSLPKYEVDNIKLTKNNFVGLREVVNQQSVGKVIEDLTSLGRKKDMMLLLDTPGGSVVDGNNLIDYLNYLNSTGIKINCVAKKAISMGFVILQQCPGERLALPSSVLMQHQMSTMMMGNILNIEKDFNYSKKLYEKMLQKQSSRIGISSNEFLDKTRDDWWMDGETAKDNNVVDKLVNIGCSKDLVKQKIIISKDTLFGAIKKKVSKCPII